MSDAAYAVGRLLVRQAALSRKLAVREHNYDVIMCAVSWESRCTFAISSLGRRIPKLYAFRFEMAERETSSKKRFFLSQLESVSEELEEIELAKSLSYAENVKRLDDFLTKRVLEFGRPVRVLCDITCFPKSYLLVLLGMGFEKGYFARFDCIYSEGDYSVIKTLDTTDKTVGADEGPLSEGKWDSLPVPFLEANAPIPSTRDLLVTLGGEIGLAVPFIEKYEPTRLGLVAIRGAKVGDEDALRELLREPNVVRREVEVCDVLGVVRYASEFCEESSADVVTALAVGSKPHALGLGIAALNKAKIEIICRIPKRYTMLDVPPNGMLLLCEIEDRFEPHAYQRGAKLKARREAQSRFRPAV